MEAAALLALFCGVGVSFGWQPMPDDASRYEYIVQLEPEMLESLAAGQSVPLSGDVPDEVRPIARVRVVVGRGKLPQRRVVTQLKPASEGAAIDAGGVLLTQFTEPPAPRYGMPPAVAPIAGAPGGFDPYTQVPPTSGAWNAGASDAAAAAAVPPAGARLARVGDGIQKAVEPLGRGIDRLGSSVRTAADNLGDRTGELLDELGRPLRPGGLLGGAAPPASGVGEEAPPWNGGDVAVGLPAGDEPSASWNADPPAGVSPPPLVGTEPDIPPLAGGRRLDQPIGGDESGSWNDAPPLTAGGAGGDATADPWANADDPRLRSGAGGEIAGGPPAGSGTWPSGLPLLPEYRGGVDVGGTGPLLGDASGGIAPTTGPPAVTGAMLSLPEGRSLDGAATLPALESPALGAPASDGAANGGGLAAAQGWDVPSPGGAAPGDRSAAAGPGSPDSDVRQKALVLVAWVLLSGSAAGNIYLFWSYLDVRTKYRALVRRTARAVGNRFSAA